METVPFAPPTAPRESMRELYLQRLRRLQRLRQLHEPELNRQGLRLLDRALFAAYCECRDIGAEEEARATLGGASCLIDPAAKS